MQKKTKQKINKIKVSLSHCIQLFTGHLHLKTTSSTHYHSPAFMLMPLGKI